MKISDYYHGAAGGEASIRQKTFKDLMLNTFKQEGKTGFLFLLRCNKNWVVFQLIVAIKCFSTHFSKRKKIAREFVCSSGAKD